MTKLAKFKQIWVREETKKALKVKSAKQSISIVDLLDRMVDEDLDGLDNFYGEEKNKRRRGRQSYRDF